MIDSGEFKLEGDCNLEESSGRSGSRNSSIGRGILNSLNFGKISSKQFILQPEQGKFSEKKLSNN